MQALLGDGRSMTAAMNGEFLALQRDHRARASAFPELRAKVLQQGFDLTPVKIAPRVFAEDGSKYFLMFFAHLMSCGDQQRLRQQP